MSGSVRGIHRRAIALAIAAVAAIGGGFDAPAIAQAEDEGSGGCGGAFRILAGTGLGDVGPDDRMQWRVAGGWSTALTGGVGLELLLGGQAGRNRQSQSGGSWHDVSFEAIDVRADLLLGYGRSRRGLYAIAGLGVGLASVDLEDGITVSDFDTEVVRWRGETGTVVLDVGIGVSFVESMEARLESPIYLFPTLEDGDAGEFVSVLISFLYRI